MPTDDNRVIQPPWVLCCLWPMLLGIVGAGIGAFLFPLVSLLRMDFAHGDDNIVSLVVELGRAVAIGVGGGFACGFWGWFIGWGMIRSWAVLGWWMRRRSREKYLGL